MTRLPLALAAASTLALAGCQYLPWYKDKAEAPALAEPAAATPVVIEKPAEAPVVEDASETCDVLESRDWSAWVNKMPGPGAIPTVHVTGKVDVRTGGYAFEWQEGPLDRSATPTLRLKLVAKAPGGMATQAITTEEVKYEAPALAAKYGGVLISCGSTTLAQITDVPDVQ